MNKRILNAGFLIILIGLHFINLGLCATEDVVILEDSEGDLRMFDGDWIDDKVLEDEDWDDLTSELNDVYEALRDNWDNAEASQIPPDMNSFDYVDVVMVELKDLDEDTAKMVVTVKGDAEDPENAWYLFIWSDCEQSDDEYLFFAVFIPEGLGGESIGAYYTQFGDGNETGEVEFDDGGSEIMMDFPSDWYDEERECNPRLIMGTPEIPIDEIDHISEATMIIDIYPNATSFIDLWWLWLLLIIIGVIVILGVYLVIRKRKKARSKSKMK